MVFSPWFSADVSFCNSIFALTQDLNWTIHFLLFTYLWFVSTVLHQWGTNNPPFSALQTSNKGLIFTKQCLMNEGEKYNVTGAIAHWHPIVQQSDAHPFRFASNLWLCRAINLAGNSWCMPPEGYAGGGLLGTDWYMQKKRNRKRNNCVCKSLSISISFICPCICHCT